MIRALTFLRLTFGCVRLDRKAIGAWMLLVSLISGGLVSPVVHSFQHDHHQVHAHAHSSHSEAAATKQLVDEPFEQVDCSLYAVPFCALLELVFAAPQGPLLQRPLSAPDQPLASGAFHLLYIRGPPLA